MVNHFFGEFISKSLYLPVCAYCGHPDKEPERHRCVRFQVELGEALLDSNIKLLDQQRKARGL